MLINTVMLVNDISYYRLVQSMKFCFFSQPPQSPSHNQEKRHKTAWHFAYDQFYFLTLNSERFVGMTLCPARGSHFGSILYQQLMKSLSDGFISECMGTILNRIPCLPRSPR